MIVFVRRSLISSLLVTLALGLAGCWDSERDGAITLKKGVYQGKEDTKLTHAQLEQLRRRMAYQR